MLRLALLVVLLVLSFAVIPAYAEVTSLQTDRALYAIDMNVYFSGTVDTTDSQKLVNLLVKDPSGKIILMTGKTAASDNTFQIVINTNDPSQFYLKGTYQATAFVDSASTGKTIFFDFSPDGSPVVHQAESQNGTPSQTAGVNQYKSDLRENLDVVDTLTTSKIEHSATPVGQISNMPDLGNVLYPAMAACGAAIVGFIMYRKMKSKTVSGKSETAAPTIDDTEDYALAILKNRLAKGEITIEEFKATKDVLNES